MGRAIARCALILDGILAFLTFNPWRPQSLFWRTPYGRKVAEEEKRSIVAVLRSIRDEESRATARDYLLGMRFQ